MTSYTAFVEGWALYAENPLIAHDTDVYKGQPLYKYGMLKSQVRDSDEEWVKLLPGTVRSTTSSKSSLNLLHPSLLE